MIDVNVQGGSAQLLQWDENDVYTDIATSVCENLNYGLEDLIFLEDLKNNGRKGAGLAVLQEAIRVAKSSGQVLVVFALSRGGDQAKLVNWYLGTGLLVRVPTTRGTQLSNVLIDASANLELRQEPLQDPDPEDPDVTINNIYREEAGPVSTNTWEDNVPQPPPLGILKPK